jgi:hypothetical protein|tara:strand:+ start:1059 stop:1310 length:252 start_codon:yes stop_codon:yes gene_type:complete
MSKETNEAAPVTAPEADAVQEAGPELTVQDLASLKQIIDVASQRGTFKPNEMQVVGATYTKLEAFLAAIQAQQPEQGEPNASN